MSESLPPLSDAESEKLWRDLAKLQRTTETVADGILKLDARVANIEANDRRQDARIDRLATRSGARSGRKWGGIAAAILWLATQWAAAHGYRLDGPPEGRQGAASTAGTGR